MNIHLIDGTYELFRHYFAVPKRVNMRGEEVAAVTGVAQSILGMLAEGATHVGVATDHVIESFRNEMWPGYKDGSGIEPDLLSQFELLEDAMRALGVVVWAMVEFEADDALAAAAQMAADDARVERVLICTPDKDLAQCVVGERVVQFDRRRRQIVDDVGVRAKFGVSPSSIADYLALVGDGADGYPGIKGWGAKSASAVLARYGHLENIPTSAAEWDVAVRGASRLADTLAADRDLAMLFREIATVRRDAPVGGGVDELLWSGPGPALREMVERLDAPELAERARRVAQKRASNT